MTARRRLFQGLEQAIGRAYRQSIGRIDPPNAPGIVLRRQMQGMRETTDLLYLDLFTGVFGQQPRNVWMGSRPALSACRALPAGVVVGITRPTKQCRHGALGEASLADARRATDQQSMSHARAGQRPRHVGPGFGMPRQARILVRRLVHEPSQWLIRDTIASATVSAG